MSRNQAPDRRSAGRPQDVPAPPPPCDDCAYGDHTRHRADLGGICVGCPCPGGES